MRDAVIKMIKKYMCAVSALVKIQAMGCPMCSPVANEALMVIDELDNKKDRSEKKQNDSEEKN